MLNTYSASISCRSTNRFLPSVELLEDRWVPSTTPLFDSWITAEPNEFAQVISQYDPDAGPSTTWPDTVPAGETFNGGQSTPVLGDIPNISYSDDWVYLEDVSGLPTFVLGPWFIDGMFFPNFPSDQMNDIRITRSPQPAVGEHTATTTGLQGVWVNGLALFNFQDGFSWDADTRQDLSTVDGGDGVWNRDAAFAEVDTFDTAGGHSQKDGVFHFHDDPGSLRAQLGDNIVYTGGTDIFPYDPDVKTGTASGSNPNYHEDTSNLVHSPILGWSFDGYPVYGPYGYSDPSDPTSPIRRMETSYQLRSVADRTTLPGWAAQVQFGDDSVVGPDAVFPLTPDQYGPDVSDDFPLGRYTEDYEYVPGLGDLDQYNVRWTVTPEFPNGTYAYFVTIDEAGESVFPYILGPQYFGEVTSGIVDGINEPITVLFDVSELAGNSVIAVGSGSGGVVSLFDPAGAAQSSLQPFGNEFAGSVRTAAADFNGDLVPDTVAAAGPGGGPRVVVIDGQTGSVLFSFFAYDPSFTGGVNVAVGDVTGDGVPDIVTGTGAGGGPHVKVFDGVTGAEVRSFFAYDPSFRGGVNVAVGDVNGDGFSEIITGAGQGGGPQVNVFDGATGGLIQSFFAYDSSVRGGVAVAAGDVDGDRRADVIAAAGPGGGPDVKVFNPTTGTETDSFFAYSQDFTGGVTLTAKDVDGDGLDEVVTGPGPGGGPQVKAFDVASGGEILSFLAFDEAFRDGVFVG